MSKTQIVTGGIADDAVSEEHIDATAITGSTALAATPADTDELLISDAGTLKRIDFSHIKSSLTPSFMAYNSSNQTLATGTFTKATLGGEVWDTDSAFGSSKFTVPSGQDGKYHFTAGIHIQDHTSGRTQAAFYKNGSIVATNTGMGQFRNIHHEGDTTYMYMSWNGDLSATDYIELFCEQTGGSDENIMLGTWLSGFKLTGV